MNFNLLDAPWIPVLWRDGNVTSVGIMDALAQAGHIRQIAASNPIDNVALLRLLLSVLGWCKSCLTEDELSSLQKEGCRGIPRSWLLGKLESATESFDLLRPGGGFYQVGDAGGRPVSVTNLLHDLPSGTNIAHFRHTRDGDSGLCLACCALGIVRWSIVASAGTAGLGSSMTASLNGNTPAFYILKGRSLLLTLLSTWPRSAAAATDLPAWTGAGRPASVGFLSGLTWQSRRMSLIVPSEIAAPEVFTQACCYCGSQKPPLVRHIHFRPGWERPGKTQWLMDPHLLYAGSDLDARRLTVPSWPNPNDPLEAHVSVWREALAVLLKRCGVGQQGPAEFDTLLLSNSQALYKHATSLRVELPTLCGEVIGLLESELNWVKQVVDVSIGAQADRMNKAPERQHTITTLIGSQSKGLAIRSHLSQFRPIAEGTLQSAFFDMIKSISAASMDDTSGRLQAIADWRRSVLSLLSDCLNQTMDATACGRPMRRTEARRKLQRALIEAWRKPTLGPRRRVLNLDSKRGRSQEAPE